ncbi:MAG: hypothetical protein HN489_00350 [Opitutae bacterium]|nr:hypothetical protein [Opitutae bacterium]
MKERKSGEMEMNWEWRVRSLTFSGSPPVHFLAMTSREESRVRFNDNALLLIA